MQLIRKANDLVEGRYRFSIWEMRVFTKMLTMIDKDDADFHKYRIYMKEIITDFGLSADHSAHRWFREAARGLMGKIITTVIMTEDGPQEFETPIVAGIHKTPGKNYQYLDLSFHPDMKPFLLQLKSQYLMYDVSNVLKLPSVYSIRLYELLKQYEKIGKRRLGVFELKQMLGIEYKYKLYGHFKDRVLKKAQEDLSENCDIKFEFREIKEGRKVSSIEFFIKRNPNFAQPENMTKPGNDTIPNNDEDSYEEKKKDLPRAKMRAFEQLCAFGVKPPIAYMKILPSIVGSEVEGFEDWFVESAIKHFKKKSSNPTQAGVLVNWWLEKQVFAVEGGVWSKIVENIVAKKKQLELNDPDILVNREIAKRLSNREFERQAKGT